MELFCYIIINRARKLMTLKTLKSDLKNICKYDLKMSLKNDIKKLQIFVLN